MSAEIQSVHFIGIGGMAMAASAAALQERGYEVTGSDQNIYPPASTFLAERNLPVFAGYTEQNLKSHPDLVVVGNALSRGNPEVEAVLDRKMRYCSLPELLKTYFIQGKRSLVVAGTHGKTTTAALLAWAFEHNGLHPSFLIGGIPQNFGQGARFTESPWFIIEGDEYDTAFFDKRSKFVHYLPEVAILNNLEFDHADIFENLTALETAFRRFVNLVPRNGLLLANGDDPRLPTVLQEVHCPVKHFGFGEDNSIRAFDVKLGATASEFEIPSFKFHLNLVGEVNVRNALAVVACAKHCGLKNAQIQAAFDTFKGIRRRMEVRGISGGITVVDDFGHHPTAIQETLRAMRLRFAHQKLWAIFEPRSNTTRRNVFQEQLSRCFDTADAVILAQVARLEQLSPEERLDPDRLVGELQAVGKEAAYIPEVDSIVEHLAQKAQGGDVICVFSNGAFGDIHAKLLARMARR